MGSEVMTVIINRDRIGILVIVIKAGALFFATALAEIARRGAKPISGSVAVSIRCSPEPGLDALAVAGEIVDLLRTARIFDVLCSVTAKADRVIAPGRVTVMARMTMPPGALLDAEARQRIAKMHSARIRTRFAEVAQG